jgi:metal-responsive CopG/Arc/MetJ family transcriptional regulator
MLVRNSVMGVSVRLPQDLVDALEEKAAEISLKMGISVSRSHVLRMLLQQGLDAGGPRPYSDISFGHPLAAKERSR